MTPRALSCYGVPSDTLLPSIPNKSDPSSGQVKDPNSKTQLKKMKKLEAANAKKALKTKETENAAVPASEVESLHITGDQGS